MQSLHIMLDGYNLGLEKGTGVATYGRNLSHVLKASGAKVSVVYGSQAGRSPDPLLSEIAFFDAARRKSAGIWDRVKIVGDAMLAPYGCAIENIPLSGRVVFNAFASSLPQYDYLLNSTNLYKRSARTFRWFNRFARVNVPGVDIAHWTYPLPIRARNAVNIYTLHDLVPLRLPHTTLDHKRRYLNLCRQIATTADHIVTVSEASKQDIVNLLGVDEEKVTNTYQSVEFPREATGKSVEAVGEELAGIFGLKYKGYFLFFGAIEPKKNIGRLIEAYLGSGVSTPLVIVGAPGWKSEDELRLFNSLKTLSGAGRGRIVQLEYLPRNLLISVIRGAKATIFPSLYEGFGLPVLESMSLGTAVITSNTSSLPELCGDASYLVDPYSTAEIANAIKSVEANSELRHELEVRGKERAKLFDEDAYKRRLDAVYQRVAARKDV